MDEPVLTFTRRRLPHWILPGSTYFVTFRLATGSLAAEERQLVLEHVKTGHGRFYNLAAVVVMPDHVHVLLKPLEGFARWRIVKGIKGVTARLLNQRRSTSGRIWQAESWDRIVRDAAEFEEKLEYMHDNPVKAGLVIEGSAYDGWYFNPEFA